MCVVPHTELNQSAKESYQTESQTMEIKYHSEQQYGIYEPGEVGTFMGLPIREENVSDDDHRMTSWSVKILGHWYEVNTFNNGVTFFPNEAAERTVKILCQLLQKEREAKVELLNLIKQKWGREDDKISDTATNR